VALAAEASRRSASWAALETDLLTVALIRAVLWSVCDVFVANTLESAVAAALMSANWVLLPAADVVLAANTVCFAAEEAILPAIMDLLRRADVTPAVNTVLFVAEAAVLPINRLVVPPVGNVLVVAISLLLEVWDPVLMILW
jgi:hypothetical protein